MGQTYPLPIPSTRKVDDGVARTNPTPTDATAATTSAVYEPNTWADKVKNHPGGPNTAGWENIPAAPADPDFVNVVLVAKSSNMPY